jgi:hypothetical protein
MKYCRDRPWSRKGAFLSPPQFYARAKCKLFGTKRMCKKALLL